MSVSHGFTHMELWFVAGALVMTCLVGAVLFPAIRNALSEGSEKTSPESASERSEGQRGILHSEREASSTQK